ncbi:MAG: deoxyribonuclease V [Ignavibacteriae bacterium]|nr:deoxyribonuclease V [Ignavibacteriota bacterium]
MTKLQQLHSWNVTPAQAIAIQKELCSKIIVEKLSKPIHTIAGCDISFDKGSDVVYAGVVVLQLPELVEIAHSTAVTRVKFPYIPGLLSFRESPAVLEAWEGLTVAPDALMIDGQGLAHPRRFGIACHLGLLLDLPTIGCAKSLLIGKYEEPPQEAGSYSPLIDKDETIGVALRTEDNVSPVFVSVGHRIALDDAIRVVMQCTKGYRIPEPTRQAHLLVNALRRGETIPKTPTSTQESLF